MSYDQFSKCSDRYKFQHRQRRPFNEEVPNVKRNEVAETLFKNGRFVPIYIVEIQRCGYPRQKNGFFSSKSEAGMKLDTIPLECQIDRQHIEKTQNCSFKNFRVFVKFFNVKDALAAEAKFKRHPFQEYTNVDFQRSTYQKRPPSFVTPQFATLDERVRCYSAMDLKNKDIVKARVMWHQCRNSQHQRSEDIKCNHEVCRKMCKYKITSSEGLSKEDICKSSTSFE